MSPNFLGPSFSETSPTYLCSALHEYSARVTNGSKPKCQKCRSLGLGGQNEAKDEQRMATEVVLPLGSRSFYAVR
jgi:hypothetical protein